MMEKMSKKELLLRLSIYYIFGAILPFLFLAWRFELFKKVSKISIGGWGLVGIIFVFLFTTSTIKKIKNGMPYSYAKQILDGVAKVILPLILAAFCVYYMQDLMKELFQFFCIVIVCELIAIFVNPLPQWEHENNIEKTESSVKKILEAFGVLNKENK